ncbi:MAG: hypothetical protein V2I46_08940 [Bacteroides sp.]|nr:hypothetical protein [Bacteroides sp.]
MKTLLTIAWMLLLGAVVQPLYAQEPEKKTPEKEVEKVQPPQTPTETPVEQAEKEEVKQVAPNKSAEERNRQRLRQDRGARPEIIRPGGRPAGAGRPKGARRPGRR